jgi:putative acetyltransferase
MGSPNVREARNSDAGALIELIAAVYDEYPGCVLDVEGEAPELLAIRSHFRQLGGRFWVAEQNARLVGSVGFVPLGEADGIELRKLYVAQSARRRGLGAGLCERVEAAARARGARFVELWSDTRFEDAHRLYAGRGYLRGADTRALHDQSASIEYYYRKLLEPRS